MHNHRWPKLMLLVAAFFLVGGAGALEDALAASAKATCMKNCRSVKKDCIGSANSVKADAIQVCKDEKISVLDSCVDKTCKKDAKDAFKLCKKGANDAFKLSKATCIGDFKDVCKLCCNTDPEACEGAVVASCPPNEAGGPNLLTMGVVEGADLDAGWTGLGHNSGVVIGASVYGCLKDCDKESNPVCTGTGPVGQGSLNGKTYGPPLPLVAGDVATCVINEFTEDITIRKLNLQTGDIEMRVKLNSVVHLTGDKKNPCPTCSGNNIGETGTCRGGPKGGSSCTTEGTTVNFGNTSSDCTPDPGDNMGELDIELDPITSGVTPPLIADIACVGGLCPCSGGGNQLKMNECDNPASCSEQVCIDNGGSDDVRKGIQPGVDQQCCKKGSEIIPCFVNDISRAGEAVPGAPLWPDLTYPKSAVGKVAAVFCIPPTNSNTINTPTGLGGPGAFILPGKATVEFKE